MIQSYVHRNDTDDETGAPAYVHRNDTDDETRAPAGGFFQATGIDIRWQNGPLGRGEDRQEPNGAFVETVIKAAVLRLEYYNDNTKFRCRENALAINHLEEALHWLKARTEDREAREVEGTHAV